MRVLSTLKGIVLALAITVLPTASFASPPIEKINQIQLPELDNLDYSTFDELELRQLKCLALNLYHEARGSTKSDIMAVGYVTRNRVSDTQLTYCQVIWEPGQFTWTRKPFSAIVPKDVQSWNRMVYYAYDIIENDPFDTTYGATHFYSVQIGTPEWASHRKKVRIGGHYYTQ